MEFLFLFARFGVELEFAVRGFAGENPEGELGSALRKARERERGHPRVEACETEGREKQPHRTVREETVERRGVFAQKERRRQVRLFDVARVGGKERLDRVGERQKNDRAHAPFVFRNGHGRAGGRSLFTAYTFGLFVRGIVGCFVGGFVGEFGCREAGVCECLGVDEIVGTVGERGRERLKDGLDAVVLQRGHPEKTRSGVFDSGGPIENRTDLARKDQTRRGAHDRAARLDVAGHRFGFRVREGEKSRRFAGGRDFPFERFEFGVRQADAGAREKTFHGFSAQIGAARIDRRLKTHGQQKSVGIAEKRHEARLGGLGGVARIGGGRFALGKGFLAAGVFLGDGAQNVLHAVADSAEVPAEALAVVLRLRKRHVFGEKSEKVVGTIFKKRVGDGVQKALGLRALGDGAHGVFGGKRRNDLRERRRLRGGELQIVRPDRARKRRGIDPVETEKTRGVASRFFGRQHPERGFVGRFGVKGREKGNPGGFGEVRVRGPQVPFEPVAQEVGRVGELLREAFLFFVRRLLDAAADRLARGGVRFDAAFRDREVREVFRSRAREETFGRRECQRVAHAVVPIAENFRMRKHGVLQKRGRRRKKRESNIVAKPTPFE